MQFDDAISGILGIDKNKEIFDLWYEIHYQRFLFAHLLASNPGISQMFKDEKIFETARNSAQKELWKRFPKIPIEFNSNQDEIIV